MSGFFRLLLAPIRIFFQVLMVVISLFVITVLLGMIVSTVEEETINHTDTKYTYRFLLGDEDSDNHLLQIDVLGPIYAMPPDENPYDFMFSFDGTYGYEVKKHLQEASTDDSVKGILLRLSTPGGTISGSRAIYEGIKAYQEVTNKPVVAFVDGISASGGVMSMVGADAIYADYGSIVGSIGVVGGTFTYFNKPMAIDGGLLGDGITTEGGIELTIISAGRGKDIGNPFRRPSEEELQILREGVNNEYDDFVQHVAENRNIEPNIIREQMGAGIFGNKQATSYKLIDGTLNYQDAVKALAKHAELDDDYQLVRVAEAENEPWKHLFSLSQLFFQATPQQTQKAQTCHRLSATPLVYYGDVKQLCAF